MIGDAREQHGPRHDAERARSHGGEPPARDARDALAHVVGEQLAGEQGECGDQHECAVDRPAEQADARHVLECHGVERRVAAQRVEQRHQQHGGHHPVGAPQHAAAGDAEPEHDDGRGGADEEIVEGAIGGADRGQGVVVRPPVDLRALERAQHVGHRQRRQVGRIERGLQRLVERHLGPIGEGRKLHRQQQRHGQQDDADDRHRRQHRGPLAHIAPPVVRRENLAGEHGGQHEAQQQSFMVAAQRQHRGDDAEGARDRHRAALQRHLHEEQHDREQPVADDDAAVLQPARGRSAEHEDDGGEDGRRQRPTRAPAERADGKPADGQVRIDDEIEGAHRRSRIEQGPQHEGRREDQRLRVGDARMSAVVIGVPERRVAAVDGGGEEAEEGVELVLGVPRHDRVGDDPAAGGDQPDGRNGGKDQGQAPVTFPHAGVLGITPDDWRRLEHARPFWRAKGGPLQALRRHVPFPQA